MSIYNLLNSDRTLLSLPANERLAAVQAAAWSQKSSPVWVWTVTFRSRLGVAGRVVIQLLDALIALPGGIDAGLQADLKIIRNSLDGVGVNVADPQTLPQLLMLKAASPSFAQAGLPSVSAEIWDTIIAWAWQHSTELGNATLEQVAEAAAKIARQDEVNGLEALAAAHWNDVVQPRLAELRADDQAELPTLAELVGV